MIVLYLINTILIRLLAKATLQSAIILHFGPQAYYRTKSMVSDNISIVFSNQQCG